MPKTLRSSKDDVLNPTECGVLLSACRDELDHLVIRVPLYTGMRCGEVQHMRASWLVWDDEGEGTIKIPNRQLCSCYECRTWRGRIWTPKTAAGVRTLLITKELEPYIKAFFSKREGVNVARQTLERRCSKIAERSGLQRNIYMHMLRAGHATFLSENGISAPSLSYLLGWSGLQSAEAYIGSSARRAHKEQREILTNMKESASYKA